jgi:hypothetical protein
MQNNDDETAFPVAIGQTAADSKGMSLRDWFAGQVIIGLYATGHFKAIDDTKLARVAYRQAEELMEARKTLG